MASLIHDLAEWFKSRKTRVTAWYEDGVGRYAFRVCVDGQDFVACARSSPPADGRTSVMRRVCGKAQTTDAYVLLRTPEAMYVFDPVTVLAVGDPDDPHDDSRAKRGEAWVYVDVEYACTFEQWVDGYGKPTKFGDVTDP